MSPRQERYAAAEVPRVGCSITSPFRTEFVLRLVERHLSARLRKGVTLLAQWDPFATTLIIPSFSLDHDDLRRGHGVASNQFPVPISVTSVAQCKGYTCTSFESSSQNTRVSDISSTLYAFVTGMHTSHFRSQCRCSLWLAGTASGSGGGMLRIVTITKAVDTSGETHAPYRV